jgi:hypothetical protein
MFQTALYYLLMISFSPIWVTLTLLGVPEQPRMLLTLILATPIYTALLQKRAGRAGRIALVVFILAGNVVALASGVYR